MPLDTQIDNQMISRPQDYDRTLFVKRKQQLDLVKDRIESAQVHHFVASPIVNFWGAKGIGKTWLLHHLGDEYRYEAQRPDGTFTLLYSFEKDPATFQVEHITRRLAGEVLNQLTPPLFENVQTPLRQAQDNGNVTALAQALNLLAEQLTPLLLFDNTELAPDSAWERIEKDLLEPLVSSNRVVVVIAGQRQVPRWHRFEVRRRVLAPEESRVPPLDKRQVGEQLKKGGYDPIPVKWLYAYTGGSPHLVQVVAHHITQWARAEGITQPDEAWLQSHEADLLPILQLAEEEQLQGIDETLRIALKAVAPLRFYRLEALRFMLTGQSAPERPEVYYLRLLRQLDQKTHVVWWNHDRRAYVTSEVVRHLMNRRQFLENQNVYVDRHQLACDMYWNWVREYPQASEDFIIEIWFHLAHIYLVKKDPDWLRQEALAALRFASERLKPDRLMVLSNILAPGDQELLDLLPNSLVAELQKITEKFSPGMNDERAHAL